jgi:HEAT repeat protein
VRYFANSSLIARIEGASARQLTAALEQDGDPEMKLQIISALGRLGTADAVQKLIKSLVSGPSRRDPAHMTSEYRCASIEAVAKARGVKAFTLISQFRSDRDERVRATAQRVCERLAS